MLWVEIWCQKCKFSFFTRYFLKVRRVHFSAKVIPSLTPLTWYLKGFEEFALAS